MSVDEAFKNMVKKQVLDITLDLSKNLIDEDIDILQKPIVTNVNTANKENKELKDPIVTIKIPSNSLINEKEADYIPPGREYNNSEFTNRPTEVNLDPIDINKKKKKKVSAKLSERLLTISQDDVEDKFEKVLNLDKVKVVRRFAYLPYQKNSVLEEQVKALRLKLTSIFQDKPSILVSSPWGKEGRTELAIRLSLALAKQKEARIVIVDFDLKNPNIANRLGLTIRKLALTDLLKKSCSAEEILVYSEEDNLYVMPAIFTSNVDDEICDAKQIRYLLSILHNNFDFIIIDSGPASSDSFPLMLANQTGTVILATRCKFSKITEIEKLANDITKSGGNLIGSVLLANN